MIYHIPETTSTNDDLRDAKYREGDIVWADFQTAGRGQRGHKWSSNIGENLLFSVALEPSFLPAAEQFLLSETVALSLVDLFAEYGIAAKIKWTNDIYVGDRKIVGIGINVNQREFDPSLPNPTSMSLQTGGTFDLRTVLERFSGILMRNYESLRSGEKEAVQQRYKSKMYRLDERHTFASPDGVRFEATIRGVKPAGELVVEHSDGSVREYLFKEIEFVL